jgi:hypothetical protein
VPLQIASLINLELLADFFNKILPAADIEIAYIYECRL